MDTNYSLSDLRAVTDGAEGFGGGNAWMLILLFLFWGFMGGNGFGYGGSNNALSTTDALMNTNFDNLSRNVQSIADRQYEQANNLTKGICELGYTTAQQTNNLQTIIGGQINTEGRSLQAQIAECCCENRLATANLGAQMDQQTSAIQMAIHAEGEATRALIQTNEIQALRDKVSSLEMDNRMSGVVKYPNAYAYNAGPSPFCGGGCNCL